MGALHNGQSVEFSFHSEPSSSSEVCQRVGRLSIPGREPISTPNFLASTSRGVIPHLTPDVLARHTFTCGAFIALEDFIELGPSRSPPILGTPIQPNSLSCKTTRLHAFTALPASIATCLSPRRVPAVKAAVGNSDTAISAFTSVGFHMLANTDYCKYVRELSPDLVLSIPDVPFGMDLGVKRRAKMEGRTRAWLDELLDSMEESGTRAETAVFAPVLPLPWTEQSEYLEHVVDELVGGEGCAEQKLAGLAFYDSSLVVEERLMGSSRMKGLVRLSCDAPHGPVEVLRQVGLGIDLFTVPFVSFTTDAGLAFTFTFDGGSRGTEGLLPLARDAFDKSGAKDTGPLMENCSCYTCTDHHVAFIAHLLAAKEMLGWVLLQVHNHHVMSVFFTQIRASMEDGTFAEKCATFERRYEPDIPHGTGERPRVRGYHFKSEGPGEPKRNKPAWGMLGPETGEDTPLVPDESVQELEEKGFAERSA